MSLRRVAVTGIGMVSAIGSNPDEVLASVRGARGGIGRLRQVDVSRLRFTNAAEVEGFDPARHFEPREVQLLDRFAQFGLVAARQAIAQAGLEGSPELQRRTAIVTATSAAGQCTVDDASAELYAHNATRLNPFTIPRTMANSVCSHISMRYGITGPSWTVSTACSSSNHAIGQAFWMVRHGMADIAITGGSEAPFNLGFLKAWEAMRVVSQETCRPFSLTRKGLILGEGAGMLVLESLEHARARGARALAEIVGFGMNSDAHHVTQPSAEGAAGAMRLALEDANLRPEDIDSINAHGTGTTVNDSTETKAIHSVFGSHAPHVRVTSTKSAHGHALGAAGALEAVITVLSLQNSLIPATLNYEQPDPECDLNLVTNGPETMAARAVLSNSFAFGGLNAVLAFRAAEVE